MTSSTQSHDIMQQARQSDSVHSADQLIDQLLSVTVVTTLNKMPCLLSEPATSVTQLEWPQEIISLLEMRAHCDDLVKQIFDADDPVLPESLLNDGVVGERDSLVLHFAIASLVD